MKTYFLSLLLLITFQALGQDIDDFPQQRQEIQAQKVAYITQKLALTPQEAQVFWPQYNAYEKLIGDQKQALRAVMKENRTAAEGPNRAELDTRMEKAFAAERKRVDIEEEYYAKFKEILPIQKVAALYQAEREFKRELLRTLRNRPNR